tara:strand:+ start:1076 stop:1609 length:534 start_codon:yes stop_codon:yes gene_type:complete
MKNVILIGFIYIGLVSQSFSQDEKSLSKMEQFVSNAGQIIKFENYNLPDLKGSYAVLKTKVRRVYAGGETKYYFIMVKEDKYGNKTAYIAEEDLVEIEKALDQLIIQSENEESNSDYLENKFTSEDGFQIGYWKGKSLKWFVTLEKYGSSSTSFNGYADLKAIIGMAQKKIQELKAS